MTKAEFWPALLKTFRAIAPLVAYLPARWVDSCRPARLDKDPAS
jgi:hypothetical protein